MRVKTKLSSKFKVQSSKLLRGQSLIEVVVALAVVTLLAISLVSTSLVTQRASRSAKNSTQATKLVEQNIEQIRVFRDRKGFDAIPVSTTSCYILSASDPNPGNWSLSTTNCTTGGEIITLNNTSFNRKIAITLPVANKKLIEVTVTWTDSGGSQTVKSQTFLTSWSPGGILPASPSP